MTSERVPSDFVKAVLHYLGASTRFPASIPNIQTSFYEICNMEKFQPLCNNIIFDTSSVYPHSDTVRFAIDRLQKSDLLACINPSLDEYEVTEQLGDDITIASLFDDTENVLLKEAATIFKEKIVR